LRYANAQVGLGYRCERSSLEADLQAKDSIFKRPWDL
jgi:hypothetical protein